MDRRLDLAEDRAAGGGRDDAGDAQLAAGVEQVERADDVVVEVVGRVLDAVHDPGVGGEVDDRVLAGERRAQVVGAAQVTGDEADPVEVEVPAVAQRLVVDHRDRHVVVGEVVARWRPMNPAPPVIRTCFMDARFFRPGAATSATLAGDPGPSRRHRPENAWKTGHPRGGRRSGQRGRTPHAMTTDLPLGLIHFNHEQRPDGEVAWTTPGTGARNPNYGDMLVCAALVRQLAPTGTVRGCSARSCPRSGPPCCGGRRT